LKHPRWISIEEKSRIEDEEVKRGEDEAVK
jgi:hypothetical protein